MSCTASAACLWSQALIFDAHNTGFRWLDNTGFWLVQIIHDTLADLGYTSPCLPDILNLRGHQMFNFVFLGQGRKAGSSYVYRADTDEGHALPKLNHTAREVNVTFP